MTHVELQSDGSRDLAAVYHLCVTYEKPLEDAAKKHVCGAGMGGGAT